MALLDTRSPRAVSAVVAIALKSSDGIPAGQALGPNPGACHVDRSDAVGSASSCQLGGGVARGSENGRKMQEVNFLAD